MRRLATLSSLILITGLISVKALAQTGVTPETPPMARYALIYGRIQDAKYAGRLEEAKKILLEEAIPELHSNSLLLAVSRICFELKQYREAAGYYDKFMLGYRVPVSSPIRVEQNHCYGILVKAAAKGVAPDWRALPTLNPQVNPVALLERECQMAAAEKCFRTAKLVLVELKRVGASSEMIKNLQTNIDNQSRIVAR